MPNFERSAAVDALVEMMLGCEVGSVVSWAQMKLVTNRDITGDERHLVSSARRIVITQHRIAFGTIRGVGLQRLKPGEHALEGRRRVKLIGKAARRGKKVMQSADIAQLTKDQVLTHSAVSGVLQAIDHSSRQRLPKTEQRGNSDPVVVIPAAG